MGTPFYFEEKFAGGSVGLSCVVTEWVENEAIAFRMTQGPILNSYEERWTVAATPPGSSFTLTLEAEVPSAIINRLVGPLAQRSSAANVEKMLPKLKSLAES